VANYRSQSAVRRIARRAKRSPGSASVAATLAAGSGTAYVMQQLLADADLRELDIRLSNHELTGQAKLVAAAACARPPCGRSRGTGKEERVNGPGRAREAAAR
jgi:hypothetical protein